MASSKSSQHGRVSDVRPLDNRMPTKNNNKQKHKKTIINYKSIKKHEARRLAKFKRKHEFDDAVGAAGC